MNNPEKIIDDLEKLLQKKLPDIDIPVIKGNTIRIKHVVVRPIKDGDWLIVDTLTNKTVTTTFSKLAAVAIAKAYIKSKSFNELKTLDSIIEKNFNDSMFFAHNLKITQDELRKGVLQCRFDICKEKIDTAKDALDKSIMSDFR